MVSEEYKLILNLMAAINFKKAETVTTKDWKSCVMLNKK